MGLVLGGDEVIPLVVMDVEEAHDEWKYRICNCCLWSRTAKSKSPVARSHGVVFVSSYEDPAACGYTVHLVQRNRCPTWLRQDCLTLSAV